MENIIFINSHPIQYYAPMYQYLTKKQLAIEVWYGDDSSIAGRKDKGFGQNIIWDIPLLEGYKSKFFKNQAIKPTPSGGFFNVLNFNMAWQLLKTPKSILIINGWQFATYFLCAIFGFLRGHQLWMRCEMPWNQEVQKTSITAKIKRFFLKYFYFPMFKKYLYIGSQNKEFYIQLGVNPKKLFFAPYAVDNNRFSEEYKNLLPTRNEIREKLNIPVNAKVVLYSGKYIHKKRPMDLLKAFEKANVENKFLIFLGDGELRSEMEKYISVNNIKNVLLTGFINQAAIAEYYTIADVFVMCSSIGETWGLSVNEAMNFGLPVIASTDIGSAYDLIQSQKNGLLFKTGDILALQKSLEKLFDENIDLSEYKKASINIINQFSYKQIFEGLKEASL